MNSKNSRYNDACQKLTFTGKWPLVLKEYPDLHPALSSNGEAVICPFCTLNAFKILPKALTAGAKTDTIAHCECGSFSPVQLIRKCLKVPRVTKEMKSQIETAAGFSEVIPASTALIPEIVPAFEHYSKKNKPLGTLENFQALLDCYAITVRYNKMTHQPEISIPELKVGNDNELNVHISSLESLASRWEFPHSRVASYVLVVADKHSYHPVIEWIFSKKWDGVDRIQELMNTIETDSPDLRDIFVYRWLVSAVAALFEKRFWSKGVLTFQGPQDLGKTSWFRSLYPSESGFGLEGRSLDPSNKDSLNEFISHWLIELGELESTMKRDIAALKAFISNSTDELRQPYAKAKSTYRRRTVMFASVNTDRFLKDQTGNTRFWCLPITKLNHQHNIDIQQLWAQVANEYENGAQWYLTSEEAAQLAEHNQQFEEIDPIEEKIVDRYRIGEPATQKKTATDILIEIGYFRPSQSECIRCGIILTRLFGKSTKNNGKSVFRLPPCKPEYEPIKMPENIPYW